MSKVIQIDTKTLLRFWVVLFVLVFAGLLVMQAWTGIMVIVAGLFLAVALTPLAKKINKVIGKKKDRQALSSVLAVLVVVLTLVTVGVLVGPKIVEQCGSFLEKAPHEISTFLDNVDLSGLSGIMGTDDVKGEILEGVQNFTKGVTSDFSNLAVTGITAITGFFTAMVFSVVLAILFMLQGPHLLAELKKCVAKRESPIMDALSRVTKKIADVIQIYVSRQVFIAILDGIVAGCSVFVISLVTKVDAGIAIPAGLISAICYLIPMFGPVIACVLNGLLLVLESPFGALWYVVLYVIYAQVEANIISPKVQGKGLNLSPLIILIAIILGTYAFGLIGCIIAIPITGIIKVFIDEWPTIRTAIDLADGKIDNPKNKID